MIELDQDNELVERILQGDRDALPELAENIYETLQSYVFRITLSDDLTDDIVQETIIEMYKIFGQLRDSEHFWPWLRKIALNKVRSHSKKQNRRRHLLQKHAEELSQKSRNLEGLAHIINDEIKGAILQAMSRLTDQQKAVLSMRCYDNMSYSQIADVMDVSELSGRLIFHRAKKKLQKQLCRSGFGSRGLIAALIIFGKMTSPSEAAAAQICVTSSTLGVGAVATTVATMTTKTAALITAGCMITAGVVTNEAINTSDEHLTQPYQSTRTAAVVKVSGHSHIEGYYYYPEGSNGPVMTRLSVSQGKKSYKVLQNDNGNYFQNGNSGKVTIENYHYWNRDVSALSLPTDSPEVQMYLNDGESIYENYGLDFTKKRNLLIATSLYDETNKINFSVQNYNALMEERFHYNWPAKTSVIDNRDALHKQGWCYFDMQGDFKGQKIIGYGRMPLRYSLIKQYPPLLALKIGSETEILNDGDVAALKNSNGRAAFFDGLSKPWMGLHCIDSIRRDAVLNGMTFDTQLLSGSLCKVSVICENGIIEYTVDLHKDLIRSITFLDASGETCGHIAIEYTEDTPEGYKGFRTSSLEISVPVTKAKKYWLAELVCGNL
jgi:RNA polymerase sigma-70 factor (ECF subfamily)